MAEEHGLSVKRACQAARLSRAAYYRPEADRATRDREIVEALNEWAELSGIKLLYIEPGKPNQNAFVERFNRTFREEVLDAHLFNRLGDVQRIADEWLTDYNEYRPHESLGDVPPVQFMPRSFQPEVSGSELSA